EPPESWVERATLRGHQLAVWCVAFSPDGKRLASGAGGTVEKPGELWLWDVATGQVIFRWRETRSVRSVAFSPDGQTLATAEFDKTAKLRDAASGRVRFLLQGHGDGVNSVAFSPDGNVLATAGWDQTVRFWDTKTGKELRAVQGHADEVYS